MAATVQWKLLKVKTMQVAVISDLHLGRGSTDIFGHEDNEFLRFLDFLEDNFEQVVLLGDIWETLTAPSPAGQLTELRAAQAAHREIHDRFRRSRYKYVHGNHDLVAGKADGICDEHCLEVDGVRVLFSHGHQGDGFCSTVRPIGELSVWLGGWIRRFGLQLLYTYLSRLESGRHGRAERCSVRRWALGQARTRDVDVVVTGHTHIPVREEEGTTLFLNSGTCAQGALSFLSLDTGSGDYRVNFGY
jgi:predicted phosphodiesterase